MHHIGSLVEGPNFVILRGGRGRRSRGEQSRYHGAVSAYSDEALAKCMSAAHEHLNLLCELRVPQCIKKGGLRCYPMFQFRSTRFCPKSPATVGVLSRGTKREPA